MSVESRSIVGLGVALLITMSLGFWQAFEQRSRLVDSQRAGCARGKLDRADNAAGWTAHRRYIEHVTGAKSVKEDVKRAAREAVVTYRAISVSLRERSRIDCAAAFPKTRLLP